MNKTKNNLEQFSYGTHDYQKLVQKILYENQMFDIKKVFSDDTVSHMCSVIAITPKQTVKVAFDGHDNITHPRMADIISSIIYPKYAVHQQLDNRGELCFDREDSQDVFILTTSDIVRTILPQDKIVTHRQYKELKHYLSQIQNSPYAKEGKIRHVLFEGVFTEEADMKQIPEGLKEIKKMTRERETIQAQAPISELKYAGCKTKQQMWKRAGLYAAIFERKKKEYIKSKQKEALAR